MLWNVLSYTIEKVYGYFLLSELRIEHHILEKNLLSLVSTPMKTVGPIIIFSWKRNPFLCHWNWAGNQTELGCTTTFSPIWGYSGQQEHPVSEVFGDAAAGSPPPADYLTGSSKGCPCPCGWIFILSEKVGFVGWAKLLGRENLSKQKKKKKLIETVLLLSLSYFLLSKLTLILWEFTENTT